MPDAATFISSDTTTGGNWNGVYGTAGYSWKGYGGVGDYDSPVIGLTLTEIAVLYYIWRNSTSNSIDPTKPPTHSPTDRWAPTRYHTAVELRFQMPGAMRVNLYFLDLDNGGTPRVQTVEWRRTSDDVVLDSRLLGNAEGGKWMLYDIDGDMKLKITTSAGPNSVVSGITFDELGGGASGQPMAKRLGGIPFVGQLGKNVW